MPEWYGEMIALLLIGKNQAYLEDTRQSLRQY